MGHNLPVNTHTLRITRVAAAAACLLLALGADAPAAHAGGFELPEGGARALSRGGAFTVGVDDPSALLLNPGALIRLRGTHLLYNHVLISESATFTRQASDLPPGTDYSSQGFDPLAPVSNEETLFPLGAMLLATSDFGLDDFTFAAGIYGPNAHGKKRYPTSGGQRYMLTSLDAILFYPSLSVAYGQPDTFGVGLTLQWVMAPSLKLGLVVDGSQAGELHAYYSGNDVEARIALSDMTSFTALLGAWWRPTPAVELGVSGRVVPAKLNLDGEFTLHNVPGQTQFSDAQLSVTGSAARLDMTLPPTARAGVRYRGLDGEREVWDLELNVVYEAWSMMERYDVQLDGIINLFVGAEAPNAVIEKRWMDTLSVRLGGSWNAWEAGANALQLSAGAYYESPTVPKNYEHLDFLAFDRVGLGLGATATFGDLRLTLAYSHVFQGSRDVDERYGKVYQQRPLDPCPDQCDGGAGWSGVPANAGHYESSYDLFAAALELSFL
ncbi:MAG: hypothetical protein EP329_04525 [Deltaproteobacteria bacterium]|nr:MAG: hypothetical protein EP329_04525 [Deltaproteobacteria bacterium]